MTEASGKTVSELDRLMDLAIDYRVASFESTNQVRLEILSAALTQLIDQRDRYKAAILDNWMQDNEGGERWCAFCNRCMANQELVHTDSCIVREVEGP